jgi:hypothetical protein
VVGRALRVLVVSSLIAAGALSVVGANVAWATTTATSVGYDVSFPQCGHPLPASSGFGVVGVDNGHPFSVNPCLASETTWAGTTLSASPQFYVNTDNPGPSNNANWPTSQAAPQVCSGANSVACSYDYGWNAAQASFQAVVSAETQLSAASPTAAALGAQWWLDVETGNAWQSLRTGSAPTAAQFANDAAAIQGQIAYFASVGIGTVGIYATSQQWSAIAGATTNTTFAQNPLWVPGYATLAAATAACSMASFTGGRIAMIQYPSNGLDGDYVCGLIVTPASATVSLAAVTGYSTQLVVEGESAVTFTQSTGSPNLLVSPSGLVTVGAALPAGTYSTTGTASAAGLSGNFSFALTVGTLVQTGTTSAAASVLASTTFTTQLTGVGGSGPLSFATTSGATSLLVSPSGLVTTNGALARGSYKVSGTMGDAFGDLGTFTFTLKVGALAQSSPIRTTVTPAASATFTNQITATGGSGALAFTQSTGAPALAVSPTGLVTTSGTLANGSYVVRGVVSDASGDQGSYFFNLLVSASTLTQSSPSAATVAPAASATYTSQITATGGVGTLTFTQTRGAPSILVSSTGTVTAGVALAPGTYVASGTVTDPSGDSGSFTLTLTVAAATPALALPVATRVIGHAVRGHTVTVRIVGRGFIGRPTVVGPGGTTATVVGDTGTVLTVRVRVDRRSRPGVHTFVIAMSNGKIASVRFVQR